MGPGDRATATEIQDAYELGMLIAQQGWVLLTGGRSVGVMDAASQGAQQANGLVVGILPRSDRDHLSAAVDIAIITDMGNARNNINVLSSDVVIACGMGTGTASEVALALKGSKKVILLNTDEGSQAFFRNLAGADVLISETPKEAIRKAKEVLQGLIF